MNLHPWARRTLLAVASIITASFTPAHASYTREAVCFAPMAETVEAGVFEDPPLVNERAFNSKAVDNCTTAPAEGWTTTEMNSSRLTIVQDGTAIKSSPNVAQVLFPAGFVGNNAPSRAIYNFPGGVRTARVDVWTLLSSNWQGPLTNGSVFFSLNIGGSRRISFEAFGSGSGTLQPAVYLPSSPDIRKRLLPNVIPGAQVTRNSWQKWTVYITTSTAGGSDGLVSVYLNDVNVLRYTDVQMIATGKTDSFNQLDWRPVWGGSGDLVSQNMTMKWDHVIIYGAGSRLTDQGAPPPPPVASVVLLPSSSTVILGDSTQFTATAYDASNNPLARTITYTSTNTSVATVDATGKAKSVSVGTASIIAASEGKADTSTFTVSPIPVAYVVQTPVAATIYVGATQTFTATPYSSTNQPLSNPITWSSLQPSIATVNSSTGVATGVSAGIAKIVAAAGGKADTSDLTVQTAPTPPSNGYYVSVSGLKTNNGSVNSPWGLQWALGGAGGVIQPGDTIWLRGGTYDTTATVGWNYSVNGNSSARVVFSGYPGETPVIKKQFRGSGDYVTLRKLVFEGPIDTETNQVYLSNTSFVIFTQNEIRLCLGNAGLSLDNTDHMEISHNYIHDNGDDTSRDHGIYFKTTTGVGTTIVNNLLINNAARGISLHDNNYDGVTGGVFDVVVMHNTVVDNGSTGILINDGDRNVVANNVVMQNGDDTGQRQIRVLSGNNNKIYNNVTWHTTATTRRGIENTTTSVMSGNVIADPLFISYYGNLRLQAGSPAINAATLLYTTAKDYDFLTRDANPDIGAYERQP